MYMFYEIKIFAKDKSILLDSIIFADNETEAKAKLNSKIIMIMYQGLLEDEKIEISKRSE